MSTLWLGYAPAFELLRCILEDTYSVIWSSLRGSLVYLTFDQMKIAAGAATLQTVALSHISQGAGSSKGQLADAIDSLFWSLPTVRQERVTTYMVKELIERLPTAQVDLLEERLERIGWHLVEGEPVPLKLRLYPPHAPLPPDIRTAIQKVIRRYRDGDFDGAMTSAVGIVDTIAKQVSKENGILTPEKNTSYHNRVITAHRTQKTTFARMFATLDLDPTVVQSLWTAQDKAVNKAAYILGSFRRHYSDTHGPAPAKAAFVQIALNSALFLVHNLLHSMSSQPELNEY